MLYEVELLIPEIGDPKSQVRHKVQVMVKEHEDGLKAAKLAVAQYTPQVDNVKAVWEQQTLDGELGAAVAGLAKVVADSDTTMTMSSSAGSVTVTPSDAQRFLDENPYADVDLD